MSEAPKLPIYNLPEVPSTADKEKSDIIKRAEYLIANGFVKDLPLDQLIKRITENGKDPFDSYEM